jgi:hypothetical protein
MRLCEIGNWIALVVRGRRDTKFPRSRLRGSHLDVLSPCRRSAAVRLVPRSRHVGIDQRLWMYGPNQSPVDAGKKSVSWKLSGADSGRITDHPQRKYSIENSERALKCSAGFPEVDGKGAGDHARKSKKTAFFVRMLPEMFSALQTLR